MRGTRALGLVVLVLTSACGVLLGTSGDDTPTPPPPSGDGSVGIDGALSDDDVGPVPDPFDAGETADADSSVPFDAGADVDASSVRIAFVTVKSTTGAFGAALSLSQLELACAKAAPPPFSTHGFTPLVDYSTSPALGRLTQGPPWRRLDGMKISDGNPKDLVGGFLVPLNIKSDGTSVAPGEHVWVGGPAAGSVASSNCSEWTTTGKQGVWGDPTASGVAAINAGQIACSTLASLYCFEK